MFLFALSKPTNIDVFESIFHMGLDTLRSLPHAQSHTRFHIEAI